MEKEEREEKGAKGGSGSHGPECQGPRQASRTPGGAAGRGETEGPALGVSTFEGGHKLTFLSRSAGALVSAPSVLLAPVFRPHASIPPSLGSLGRSRRFVPRVGLAWAGLGVCAALDGHSGGRGSQPDPKGYQGLPPPMSAAGKSRSAIWVGLGTFLGVRRPQLGPQACAGLMPQNSGNKFLATEN